MDHLMLGTTYKKYVFYGAAAEVIYMICIGYIGTLNDSLRVVLRANIILIETIY